MSCSLDNVRKIFEKEIALGLIEETESKIVIDIDLFDSSRMVSQVNLYADQFATQGYNKAYELFTFNENGSRLTINKKVFDDYDNFVDGEVIPQARIDANDEFSNLADFNHEDDQIMNEDDQEAWENASAAYNDNPTSGTREYNEIFQDPQNFRDWRETMEALLEKAEATRKKLSARRQGNQGKIRELDKLIKEYTEEIIEFEEDNLDKTLESVHNELSRIEDILSLGEEDPLALAEIIETNQVRERLDRLGNAFLRGKNREDSDILKTFLSAMDSTDAISSKIDELNRGLNNLMGKIIHGVISNNTYVKQIESNFLEEGKSGEKKWEEFSNKIDELLKDDAGSQEVDGDSILGFRFLGVNSYDSIYADIVGVIRDMNKSREAGITLQWKRQLRVAYDKLKGKKIGKRLVAEMFFDLDEFGQITNKLIDPYTQLHFDTRRFLNDLRKDFYFTSSRDSDMKSNKYRDWMDYQKENTDYIQLSKVARFANRHQNNPKFREFFKSSQQEMIDYENYMVDKMGRIAFEMALEEQGNKAEDYLMDEFADSAEAYTKNPLRFVEHFYSDEYNQRDSQTGFLLVPYSSYTSYVPKVDNKDFFNKDFIALESSGIDGVKDFYSAAKNILDYVRESGNSAGVFINHNEIINLGEGLGRAALSDLRWDKKIGAYRKNAMRTLFASFYEGPQENIDMDAEYDPNRDRKLKTGYYDYGKNVYLSAYELYTSYTHTKIVEKAREEGLIIPGKYLIPSVVSRDKIAEALARKIVNKSSSLDILKRINYASSIAESLNTRLASKSILDMMIDHAKSKGFKNTENYLSIWGARNIDQVGYIQTSSKILDRMERKKIKHIAWRDTKKYTDAERAIIKEFEGEKENMEGKTFNFKTKEGTVYRPAINGYESIDKDGNTEELSYDQVAEAYDEYITEKIENLGKHPTLGTIMNGIAYNAYRSYLSYSPMTGVNNRMQGFHQNNQAAATGLYGFGFDELHVARRFMTGIGFDKIVDYMPEKLRLKKVVGSTRLGQKINKKREQWKIAMHLAENLGFLDNVMEDISGGEGDSNIFTSSELMTNLKEFASDFSMNIPETYNQLETFISIIQNVMIDNIVTGEKEPLFNPKTMEFPFDPNTMELLPDYKSDTNIANWERFKIAPDGSSKQDVVIGMARHVKHKTQGNYRTDDTPLIQSTIRGKMATTFMKWYFENFNLQYGSKRIDLTTGRANVRGAKLALLDQYPTLGAYLLLNGVGISALSTGVYALVTGGTLGTVGGLSAAVAIGLSPVGLSAIALSGVSLAMAIRKNKINFRESQASYKLAGSFFKEVVVRTTKTALANLSATIPNRKLAKGVRISDETSNRWLKLKDEDLWKSRGLSLEERNLISFSAQELANKYNMYAMYGMISLALVGASYLLRALASDDDDEKEELDKRIKNIEGMMNKVLNSRNRTIADIEQFTSLQANIDLFSSFVMYDFVKMNTENKLINSVVKYNSGEIELNQLMYEYSTGIGGVVFGLPRKLSNFANPSKTFIEAAFQDPRVYEKHNLTDFDNHLRASLKVGEAKYKYLVDETRNSVRGKVKKDVATNMRLKMKKEGIELSNKEFKEWQTKNTTMILKKSGLLKNSNNTYESIIKNYDVKKVNKALKEHNITFKKVEAPSKAIKKRVSTKTGGKRKGATRQDKKRGVSEK